MIEDQGLKAMTVMMMMFVNLARTMRIFIVIMVMEMIEDQGTEVKTTKILIMVTDDNVDGHCYDGEVIEDTDCGDGDYWETDDEDGDGGIFGQSLQKIAEGSWRRIFFF